MLKKPQNVYLPIDRFQAKVFKHRDSQKRGEWVENFALALAGESKDDFAESLLSEAQYNLYKDVVRQWRFKARQALFKELGNREPTESQIIQRCIEDYGEEFVEAFELVGKKDKRKRNQSNNHGDAGSRKAHESCTHADEGASSGSTTVPKNVSTPTISTSGPRQAGNAAAEATAPSSGGSAANSYAQALDSLSDKASNQAASNTGNAQPVACRESGKFKHDKRKYGDGNTADTASGRGPEPDKFEVTTKKPNGVCADAGNGNAPEDCKSATSAQPLRPWKEVVEKSLGMTGNDKRPAGGSTPSSSSLVHPAGTVDVLSLAYSGEFQNVRLTQEQYAQLGIKFGNQQKLNRAIDSLSCQIENGEKNPANHYAELVKWANYRDDMEEKEELKAATLPHYETVSEHNARIVRESDKWIDEHFPPKRKAANV